MTSTPAADVLLITARRLADDDHGAGIRTARIARVLAERYRVIVVEPEGPASDVPTVGRILFPPHVLDLRLAASFAATEGASVWRSIRPHIGDLRATGAPVVVWADALVASAGLGQVLPRSVHVVEFANLESRRYLAMARDGSVKRRLYSVLEAAKAVGWQRRVTRRSDAVVALHRGDAEALPAGRPKLLVRNGVDRPTRPAERSAGATVLAVGSWWYGPNRAGMRRFLDRDWPRVLAAVADARLRIVGRGGEDLVPAAMPGVEVAGYIDDLETTYRDAALVLAPARSGGGSQLKLVGALAHGRVVVGPAFLARERTSRLPDRALQADDDVARPIVQLLRDPNGRHDIEQDIRRWASQSTWARTAEPLTRFIDQALVTARRGSDRSIVR